MRKNNKLTKSLSLQTQTVRSLQEGQLGNAAGGSATVFSACIPTHYYGCHVQTPSCPQ